MVEGTASKSCQSVATMLLHKAIGYGLSDVRVEGGDFVDRRIAADGYLNHPDDFTMDGFRAFLGDSNYKIGHNVALRDCVHFGKRCGDNTLCLVCPDMIGQYYRKNDPIDIAESETIPSRTLLLNKSIPGQCGWMDKRDGRTISGIRYYVFKQTCDAYYSPCRCEAEKYGDEYTLSQLAGDLGFSTMTDALNYVVPSVPTIIERLAEYLKLFVSRSGVYSLRPMVYTYWE